MVKDVSKEPFIDEVTIRVTAGSGGDGCVHFRREAFVPRGGPDGGDGGRGGDVVLRASTHQNTLNAFRRRREVRADAGRPGAKQRCTGKSGSHTVLDVPVGTLVFDEDTGECLADLSAAEQEAIVAAGGAGGLGNVHFKSSTNRAPRRATSGKPGEQRNLRLELRLLADVALLGLPNVGKSSLISRLTAARPKIANYHFTTLVPNLGVVEDDEGDGFVIADVPGLIAGASEGAGLGHAFLRHLSRVRLLVHVLEAGGGEIEDYKARRDTIEQELARSPVPVEADVRIVAINKIDIAEDLDRDELRAALQQEGAVDVVFTSAATGEGLTELRNLMARRLAEEGEKIAAEDDTPADPEAAARRIWGAA